MAGTKIIIYGLHGVPFNDPLSKLVRNFYIWIEKLTIWMNDFIVTVGQDTIDQYHVNNIGKKIPYRIVYSGIDTKKFIHPDLEEGAVAELRKKYGIKEEDVVLVNIGRFSHAKAQRYTIQSFADLKKKYNNIKLLLVGEGPLKEDCMNQAKELGVADDVIFYGFTKNVPLPLHASDIFVLTSLREGLPTVVVEASLAEIPTVSFEVEGIHEITAQNESGFIVPQYDVDALTEKLGDLIENKSKRESFGKRALEIAKENWDYSNMNKNLKEVYNHLIETILENE